MLGKLIKYEFKACGRVFFPIYLVILILSIINRIYSQYGFIQSLKNNLSQKGSLLGVQGILTVFLLALFVSLFVITIIFTIQRFKKSLLEDEGYLIFTLPVSSRNIILSKYIVSLIFVILSTLVAILSFMLMGIFIENYQFARIMNMTGLIIINMINSDKGILTAILVLILGLIIVYTNFVLSVYLSISVGQIPKFNKHRSGIGVIAFFLINIIIGYVRSFINNIMPQNVWDGVENSLSSILDNSIFTMNKCYWFMIITDIAIIGLLFYGINFILSKKLNLE